ncbi:hypothetical protein QJS04_geneDACA007325 [Acorus gramineus]|uniref:General transcription and DNA repair factor IIH subunit TFB4 n=1 Tax=Acorus gramineus TaxID=55184 RepID=A0AAV9BRY8_ACOGR|nr:hypothetical protein QJS04_geneDACA007325 [Acorus gramineus]
MVFATDLQSLNFIQLPQPVRVDFRASCFCHKKTIEMGYVLFGLFINILQTTQEMFHLWLSAKIT